MNPKFPNFNFDEWLAHFIKLLDLVDPDNALLHEYPLEIEKEKFFNQDHTQYDDFSEDFCANYLSHITQFNCFMQYVMLNDRTFDEIVIFLLKLVFPHTPSQLNILYALKIGKFYKVQYQGRRNGVTFAPEILIHISKFLNTLQITLKDDN